MSSEIDKYEDMIRSNYAAKFNLVNNVNKLSHNLIYSIEVHTRLPDLLLATLLTRQSSSFQAFIILISKGMLAQAEMILRNIAESMFIVGAIGKDNTFSEKYILSEEISRKKALTRLKQHDERNGEEADKETLELIEGLDKKIKSEEIKKYTIEQIAQLAELTDFYDTLYPLTSMAIHTSPRGLDKSLKVDDEGEVQAIHYEPAIDEIEMHLDYGISMMLYTLHEIASYFGKDTETIETLQRENNEIASKA